MTASDAATSSWEWIFWLNVPIGLLAIPLVLTRMRESFGPDTALDLPGLALVTGGALGIVWGLVRGNQAGWSSPEVIASLTAGALLVGAFVAWEIHHRRPDRRRPRRPDRRAPADGRRAAPAGGGDGLDRADRRAGPVVLRAAGAVHHLRRRRLHGHSGRAELGGRLDGRGGARQGLRRQQHDARAGRCVRNRGRRRRLRGGGGLRLRDGVHDGFAPAIGVAAALSLAGAVAGLALPGRRGAPVATVLREIGSYRLFGDRAG